MSVLDRRALDRSLLARQLLLRRHDMPVADALEHRVERTVVLEERMSDLGKFLLTSTRVEMLHCRP